MEEFTPDLPMILDGTLAREDYPLLSQKLKPFDFANPLVDPERLVQVMKDTMCKHKGIGLAANQIGVNARVIMMGNPTAPESLVPLFNPIIVSTEFGEPLEVIYEEGCLTYPGMYIKIKRARVVRVRFADAKGDVNTLTFDGLTARVVQHEVDHLEGIKFHDRANYFNLAAAKKHYLLLQRRIKNAG